MPKEEKYEKLREKIKQNCMTKYGFTGDDEVLIYLTEKLISGTDRLNKLTYSLIGLTAILAILTGVSLWLFYP